MDSSQKMKELCIFEKGVKNGWTVDIFPLIFASNGWKIKLKINRPHEKSFNITDSRNMESASENNFSEKI